MCHVYDSSGSGSVQKYKLLYLCNLLVLSIDFFFFFCGANSHRVEENM